MNPYCLISNFGFKTLRTSGLHFSIFGSSDNTGYERQQLYFNQALVKKEIILYFMYSEWNFLAWTTLFWALATGLWSIARCSMEK